MDEGLGEEEKDREFNLKCSIESFNYTFIDDDGYRKESVAVALLPDLEATETSRFFNTYLPEIGTVCLDCEIDLMIGSTVCDKCGSKKIHTENQIEVGAHLAAPLNAKCLFAVLQKNSRCLQHHLLVMSTGVEHGLIERAKESKKINITILKAADIHLCDAAPSVNKTVKE